MGSKRYVYVGPYLRIERVMRMVDVPTKPQCCGRKYWQDGAKFCSDCGKALVPGSRQRQESAVHCMEVCLSTRERLSPVGGRDLSSTHDFYMPNMGLDDVERADTEEESAFYLTEAVLRGGVEAMREQYAADISSVNQAYTAVGGKPGEVVYGVLTYWM